MNSFLSSASRLAYQFSKFVAKKLTFYIFYLCTGVIFGVNTWYLLYYAFQIGSFLWVAWNIISTFLSIVNIVVGSLLLLNRYRIKLKEEMSTHENIYFTNTNNPNNSIYQLIKIDDDNEITTV